MKVESIEMTRPLKFAAREVARALKWMDRGISRYLAENEIFQYHWHIITVAEKPALGHILNNSNLSIIDRERAARMAHALVQARRAQTSNFRTLLYLSRHPEYLLFANNYDSYLFKRWAAAHPNNPKFASLVRTFDIKLPGSSPKTAPIR